MHKIVRFSTIEIISCSQAEAKITWTDGSSEVIKFIISTSTSIHLDRIYFH